MMKDIDTFDYPYEEWEINSCWKNKENGCSYILMSLNKREAIFQRGDRDILALSRDTTIRIMRPT